MTTVQDAPLEAPLALGDRAARQLANATKTPAQMLTITPRWLVHLLPWVPVEAGIYRLNKVRHPESVDVACPGRDESELPQTFVDYEDSPREYFLNAVTTVVDVHTRAIAAFGRECTRRGVPPATVSLFGSQFVTWRGVPLIPSDKIPLEDSRTRILLLRTGEPRRGVVGLYQPGLDGEQSPGLSVRFMGASG
jgi:Phage capsid-like protein